MSTPSLDETDLKLIALLRRNARTPVAALARALGVTRATVQNRIARARSSATPCSCARMSSAMRSAR
ncbi:MAG: hypothetical protein RLZZ592_2086 [Pseudomonadota bacterium]|jgi:DNA-binding Lrp family transcriptional regulator